MKFKNILAFTSAMFISQFILPVANAGLILDFEDRGNGYLGGTQSNTVSQYHNFDFYNDRGNWNFYGPGNGSSSYGYLNGNGGNTYIELSDGGSFSFNGMYTMAWSNNYGTMGLVGYLNGQLVASQGFTASNVYTYVAPLSAGFLNIDRLGLLFHGGEGYSTVPHRYVDDMDFTINAVPEPTTLAIFALGMIGLASRRFKKHS